MNYKMFKILPLTKRDDLVERDAAKIDAGLSMTAIFIKVMRIHVNKNNTLQVAYN
jgi:hypothetical protein